MSSTLIFFVKPETEDVGLHFTGNVSVYHQLGAAEALTSVGKMLLSKELEPTFDNTGIEELKIPVDSQIVVVQVEDGWPHVDVTKGNTASPSLLFEASAICRVMADMQIQQNLFAMAQQAQQERAIVQSILQGKPVN